MPTTPDLGNASGGKMKHYVIKDIVEIGIFVGLAVVFNIPLFSIHIMPNGGSISFTLIPLFIIAIRKEWWKSFIAISIVYGLIACLMDGYGFLCYPLDYFLGYGSISIISLFRNKVLDKDKTSYLYLTFGVLLATLLRILFSTLSGIWIFESPSFIASLTYNSIYVSISGGVTLVVLLLLLKPLKIINKKYPNRKEIQ